MVKNYPLYILAGALFILGLSLGFFAGKQLNMGTADTGIQDQTGSGQLSNQLFSSQTATIRGEITGVEGNILSVKNLTNNTSGDITASTRTMILKPGQTTPSSNLSSLELNKEALINLEMTGGKYQATLIQFTSPTPSLPPVPSLKPEPAAITPANP